MTRGSLLQFRTIAFALLVGMRAAAQDVQQPDVEKDRENTLGQRLIRQSTSDDDGHIMDGIIRTMGQAAHRLEVEFDTGEETQALHQSIVKQLDEAIQVAASQRRPQRQSGRSASSDRRRVSSGSKRPEAEGNEDESGKGDPSSTKAHAEGEQENADLPAGGNMEEVRRTWGHLPMRERDEIIQGISESFLERYRDWIERYYRALQETDE